MLPHQADFVLRHGLFRGVDHGRIRSLLEPLIVRCYGPGETVAEPSHPRSALHLILSGRCQVSDVTSDGRRIILDYVQPGGIDGFLTMAGMRGHFIEAVTSSDVVTIDRETLDEMLQAEPRLAANLLWPMTRHLRRREDHVRRLIMRDPSQRLAAQLIELADLLGEPGRRPATCPRMSHEALADLLGLRRETVTLHLARLRRLGAMRVEPDRFLLNLDLLAAVRDGDVPATAAGAARRRAEGSHRASRQRPAARRVVPLAGP
ncbi:MAG TPA: Crp/Fnr family transcriptional regulator [Candidatus Dormibacteraeota bacterium]|nr:Crp/Fnr family transcriptional regulator [Candidatus Dormibacteraeota bacterium]